MLFIKKIGKFLFSVLRQNPTPEIFFQKYEFCLAQQGNTRKKSVSNKRVKKGNYV